MQSVPSGQRDIGKGDCRVLFVLCSFSTGCDTVHSGTAEGAYSGKAMDDSSVGCTWNGYLFLRRKKREKRFASSGLFQGSSASGAGNHCSGILLYCAEWL